MIATGLKRRNRCDTFHFIRSAKGGLRSRWGQEIQIGGITSAKRRT